MSNHRNIIDKNLVELCEFTNCNDILMAKCTARNVLTRAEKDIIKIEKIMFKRNETFYETMRRKDETKFQKLVEIMKEESTAQSGDVLEILEGNHPTPSSQKRPRREDPVELEEKSIWFNVQDPTTSFVGREKELRKLHEIVTRNADNDTQVAIMSQLSSVSGIGGIGKTTLAREYVKRYASFFSNNIIWINAETTSATEKSFRTLASEIGIQIEKEVPISYVTREINEYLSMRKCLIVFDNVEEYKSTVNPFIPKSYQPGKIRPYILMTSRKQRLVADCKVLSLDVLAIEDAKKFIKSKLQDCMRQIEDESVRKLATELQCLPLALQQAVSYIQNQVRLKSFSTGRERNPIEEYLKLLEENPKVPLNHEYQDETMDDYAYTVMRTWDVSLEVIQREEYGSQAIQVLEMFAYYPPENIDIQEFEFEFSEEILQHCCVILEQYSLINRVREHISMHRLVQEVIRVQNKDKRREEYNFCRCLLLTMKYRKWYYIDSDMEYKYWYLHDFKDSACYKDLVIKFRSILGKNSLSTNRTDLEILNSALEILEKNVTRDELSFPYYIFIISTFGCEKMSEYHQDCLAQKAMARLNLLIEMGQYDTLCNIFRDIFTYTIFYPGILTSKFARDVIHLISKCCYEHSAEILHLHTPYHLIQIWLNLREQEQCRMCFKMLVLEPGTESVNNIVKRKLDHPVFENFRLFNKYLLQLGIVTDDNEREFVGEVLEFCRSIPLDAEGIPRIHMVDILLCNILCLILLKSSSLRKILPCVFKISVLLRNENQDLLKKGYVVGEHFKRTMKDFAFTLNSLVIIGTTQLIHSDWAHYVDKIIKFVGTYEKIIEIEVSRQPSDNEYLNASIRELEYRLCELEASCTWCLDIARDD